MTRLRGDVAFLLILLAGSLAVNIWLTRTGASAVGPLASRQFADPGARVGVRLPRINVKSIDGKAVILDPAEARLGLIIYVLRPACVWCTRNLPNVEAIAAAATGYKLVGLSLDTADTATYIRDHKISFPVYVDPSEELSKAFEQFPVTPQTVVVGRDSVIKEVWSGAFTQGLDREVTASLGVAMPGLAPSTVAIPSNQCVGEGGGAFSVGAIASVASGFKRCATGGKWEDFQLPVSARTTAR